jgi:hypothetical protein
VVFSPSLSLFVIYLLDIAGLFAMTGRLQPLQAAASSKTAVIFRELIRAIAGQMIGVPYKFPSYHTVRAPLLLLKLLANKLTLQFIQLKRN